MTSYIPFKILRSGFNLNTKLIVADTKKLPKDVSYLRGATVKFIRVLGKTVSVLDSSNQKRYVPVEYVLSYEDKTILSTPTKDDTCFVVYAKNDHYPVGTVFETTVHTSETNELICYKQDKHNNHRIVLDSDWVIALTAPVKQAKLQNLLEKFGGTSNIPVEVAETPAVKTVEVITKPVVVEESIVLHIPTVFDYTSTDLDKFEMFKEQVNIHLSEVGEYFDISGKVHSTLMACLKQNQFYIDVAYAQAVVEISTDLLKDKE